MEQTKVDLEMKNVTLTFVGHQSDAVAQAFYTWLVDGGLEDQLIETITSNVGGDVEVDGIFDLNNETLQVAILSTEKD